MPTGGGNNLSPGKRGKPEGKDALLTVKPPPLESKVPSPHKGERGMCGSVPIPFCNETHLSMRVHRQGWRSLSSARCWLVLCQINLPILLHATR